MARNFDGVDQFIEFPDLLSQLSENYSGVARFKADNVTESADRVIFGHRRDTTSANPILFLFSILADGSPRILVRDDNNDQMFIEHTSNISAATWQTMAFTRNGDTVEIFLDGVGGDTATNVLTGAIVNSEVFDIGAVTDGVSTTRAGFFIGDLAECAIWDVTLTDAEMDSYHNGMSPLRIRPANLIFYAPLWGGTIEADYSGTGNTGTLNGTPDPPKADHSPSGPIVRPYNTQASYLKKKEIDHFYAEQLAEVTQSNTTMTTKLSIPASFFVPFGKYLIITSAQIGADNTTNRPQVRLTFNGAAPVLGSFLDYRMRGTESTRRKIYHDVRVVEADDTPTSFDFQIANSSTSTTRASNIQIFVMRLDKHFKENIDYFYREEAGSISMDPLAGQNMKSVFTEPFDLGSAEDFHVMGTCRYLTPSTSQRGFINAQENEVSLAGGGEVANIANTRLNQTYHKIKNLSSGINHRFNMDMQNGSTGAATFAEFVSIFGIKTSVFEDLVVKSSQSGNILITGADTYQTILSGTFTPTPGGAYVVLHGARFVFQSGSTLGSRRANHRFQLDNVSNPLTIDDNTLTDVQGVDDSPSIPMIAYYGNLPKVSHDWKVEAKNLLANQVRIDSETVLMFSLLPLRRFSVRGIVTEAGSAVARVVRAFLSSTGEFVGETTSNAGDGAYEICDLPGGDIFVVAFDDSGGSSFNAKIFDKVIPV